MKAFNYPYFIYTGNSYPHKNLGRAIRAVVELNKDLENEKGLKPFKKVLFLIASSRGVFTERLKKEIKDLKGEGCVELLGFVEDDDLKVIYKASAGFLFPSISEGFGLPGLEAIKAGTIALVSEIPVFKEVYKDNAFYFDPFDINSIVETMKKILKIEKKERENWIRKTQKFVKRYSWKKMATETLKLYTNL